MVRGVKRKYTFVKLFLTELFECSIRLVKFMNRVKPRSNKGVSRVVEACFNHLTKVSNVEHAAYMLNRSIYFKYTCHNHLKFNSLLL